MNNANWSDIIDGTSVLLITGAIGGIIKNYISLERLQQWKEDHQRQHDRCDKKIDS